MMTVDRETLLHQLEAVAPGLSPREIIEQSSCFVFLDGRVITYNDEVSCSMQCELDIKGAVQAEPLLAILRKLPEKELEIGIEDGELRINGKRRMCGIRIEAEIQLPVSKVEKPDKWRKLAEEFVEGVGMVQHCVSKDESKFRLTCVHIHPKYLEASDNFQVTRVTIPTGIERETLVRAVSIRNLISIGAVKVSETPTWIHFKAETGLVLSCRRYEQDYHDLSHILKFEGSPIKIPRGLGDAADKASIFSADSAEVNRVLVELRQGKVRVKGIGASGWFKEVKQLPYDGPDLEFLISPELLMEISTKYSDAEINAEKLRVNGGKWIYLTCLTAVAEAKEEKE